MKVSEKKRKLRMKPSVVVLLCAVVFCVCVFAVNVKSGILGGHIAASERETGDNVSVVASESAIDADVAEEKSGEPEIVYTESNEDGGEAASENAAASEKTASEASEKTADGTVFENTAFLGNSCIGDVYLFHLASEADFYYKAGLSVKTVFTEPMRKGGIPVIDGLKSRKYDKVFIMFGENELGWVYPEYFSKGYTKIVEYVRAANPDAVIYLLSILPVSEKTSIENRDCINNNRINEFNGLIREVCANTGTEYVDVAAALRDENGCLPEDAAKDGIHPNKQYCEKWIAYLGNNI